MSQKSNEELAESLELIAAMIEWDYPIDLSADMEEAAKRLRQKIK